MWLRKPEYQYQLYIKFLVTVIKRVMKSENVCLRRVMN